MIQLSSIENNIQVVDNFQELISTPFHGAINAMCWERDLIGDFLEIINKLELSENMMELNQEQLLDMSLSEQGQLARNILLHDLELLKTHGASPILNIIKSYERDENNTFFPADVYSFHVDRSPIPTDTFLCTYYGASSEIIPNTQAQQKVLVPEIQKELKKHYQGSDEDFEAFLQEHFYDLHYQAQPNANTISLGLGNLWKLATDHPGSKVLPCVHRAPKEKTGEPRLMLIC
jgi:hypothetical protein